MSDELLRILEQAKELAKRYRRLTGRPLGITGEIGEYEASRLLRVELAEVRQSGYDAVRKTQSGEERIQIKTRCIPADAKPGQRLGRIDLKKEWDTVIVVLLDEDFETTAIFEAGRKEVTAALTAPGSKARNERGALGVSTFKAIGRQVWPKPSSSDA